MTRVIVPRHRVKRTKTVAIQKETNSAATHQKVSSAIVQTHHVTTPRVKKNARIQNVAIHRTEVSQTMRIHKMTNAKVVSSRNVQAQPTPAATKK